MWCKSVEQFSRQIKSTNDLIHSLGRSVAKRGEKLANDTAAVKETAATTTTSKHINCSNELASSLVQPSGRCVLLLVGDESRKSKAKKTLIDFLSSR